MELLEGESLSARLERTGVLGVIELSDIAWQAASALAPWANVFLEGRRLGTTPLIRVALPPGRHVRTLKNPELGTQTSYVVDIKPGASVSRVVGWSSRLSAFSSVSRSTRFRTSAPRRT